MKLHFSFERGEELKAKTWRRAISYDISLLLIEDVEENEKPLS